MPRSSAYPSPLYTLSLARCPHSWSLTPAHCPPSHTPTALATVHPHLPIPAALLTPAQAEKALADEPAPEAASDGHVGLPGLGEHPAERGQEEEVQEGSHQRAHNLGRQGPRGLGRRSRALTHPLCTCGNRWEKPSTQMTLIPATFLGRKQSGPHPEMDH